MPAIAPTVIPTQATANWAQKQSDSAKPSLAQARSIHHAMAQDVTSEDAIWQQLEPIYSWVGI